MTYQEQQDAIKNKVVGTVNDASDRASSALDKASRQAGEAKKQVVNTASDYATAPSMRLTTTASTPIRSARR